MCSGEKVEEGKKSVASSFGNSEQETGHCSGDSDKTNNIGEGLTEFQEERADTEFAEVGLGGK